MKKVIVTGGGGFLGSHIVAELKKRADIEVFSLSRKNYPELGVENIPCDISDSAQLDQVNFSDVDAIIHTAAIAGVWGHYDDYYRVNFLGTKNLVDKAKAAGVKYFVYTSTPSVVFGQDDIVNGNEELAYPSQYFTDYAKTKSMAEKYVLDNNADDFNSVALRPHLIWGPGDPHLIPRIIKKAKAGKLKRVGDGENLVDVIYVKNAALAHLQALDCLWQDKKIGGNAYFVGQERPVNLWQFIDTILAKKNMLPLKDSVSYKTAFRLGQVLEWVYRLMGIHSPEPPMTRFVAMQLAKNHYFSHAKAKRDFNYAPVYSIEEGLAETFKEQKPLQSSL